MTEILLFLDTVLFYGVNVIPLKLNHIFYWCVVKKLNRRTICLSFRNDLKFISDTNLVNTLTGFARFELNDFGHLDSFELRFSVNSSLVKTLFTASRFNWFELYAINQRIGLSDFVFVVVSYAKRTLGWIKWKLFNKNREKETKAYARVSIKTTRQTTIIKFKFKVKSQMRICTEFKLIEPVPFI